MTGTDFHGHPANTGESGILGESRSKPLDRIRLFSSSLPCGENPNDEGLGCKIASLND